MGLSFLDLSELIRVSSKVNGFGLSRDCGKMKLALDLTAFGLMSLAADYLYKEHLELKNMETFVNFYLNPTFHFSSIRYFSIQLIIPRNLIDILRNWNHG